MNFDFFFFFLVITEFVINPNGKSEVCILHEYMQRVLKVRPVYNFFECGKFSCKFFEVFELSCLSINISLVMCKSTPFCNTVHFYVTLPHSH